MKKNKELRDEPAFRFEKSPLNVVETVPIGERAHCFAVVGGVVAAKLEYFNLAYATDGVFDASEGAGDLAGASIVRCEDFPDAIIGQPLPWPRIKRDALLSASDWTQQRDLQATKPEEWKTAWSAYRQALRDLPRSYPDPLDVVWPAAVVV